MKEKWEAPILEELDIRLTKNGGHGKNEQQTPNNNTSSGS